MTSAVTGWIVPLGLLALWQASSAGGLLASNVLPRPRRVAAAALAARCARASSAEIWRQHLARARGLRRRRRRSASRSAIANGLSRLSATTLTDTTLQMVRNIPHLALIPLVILWFGIDEEAKLFLVALGVFFPIYVNTLLGIRASIRSSIEMGRIYGMGRSSSSGG